MSKGVFFLLFVICAGIFFVADFIVSLPPNHTQLEIWRPGNFHACAPCGAPCQSNNEN